MERTKFPHFEMASERVRTNGSLAYKIMCMQQLQDWNNRAEMFPHMPILHNNVEATPL